MSEASDEGFNGEVVDALDRLLSDHPELLGVYEQWMALQVTLQFEFSLNGETFVSQASSDAGVPAEEKAQPRAPAGPATTRRFPQAARWGWAIAASLLVAATGYQLGWRRLAAPAPPQESTLATAERNAADSAPGRSWPRLRVASFSRGEATPLAEANAPLWLDRFNSYPARGYLVTVPPGKQIEALVDASAEGANELVIVELNAAGDPLRQATLFSNEAAPGGQEPADRKRFGRIGRWTDYNSGQQTRYYLFAGLHRLMADPDNSVWRVSDFAVLINDPGFLHVGWDDSGVTSYPTWPEDAAPPKDDYLVDRDYDDVCASIRVYDPEQPRGTGVRLIPPNTGLGALPPAGEDDHLFVLPAGGSAVLRFVLGSEADTKVAVANAASNQIVWRSDNQEFSGAARLRFNTDRSAGDKNRGALYLENNTEQAQTYRIAACYRSADDDAGWIASSHRVLLEEPDYRITGFQGGESDLACQDIWVTAHRLDDEPQSR